MHNLLNLKCLILKIGNILSSENNQIFNESSKFLGIDQNIFLLLIFILFVGLIRLYTIWFQNQFSAEIGHSISNSVFLTGTD